MNKVPITLMRGGTSKGVFLQKKDLPEYDQEVKQLLLDIMGSPDPNQIDGLGGANSLTSKVAIIDESSDPLYDVEYTFAQVSLYDQMVDFKGNCGNISSAVGPYAIAKGLVPIQEPITKVRIFNTNTNKIITAEVEVENGRVKSEGNYSIPGVPGSGSPIFLSFENPEGAVTGKVLPTCKTIDVLSCSLGEVNASIVDIANPLVFVRAQDIGLRGDELPEEYSTEQLALLEELRSAAAEICGFASKTEATALSPATPKMAVVSKPLDYQDSAGQFHKKKDFDVLVRMMSMQRPHKALAITGAVCITAASKIEGTILSDMIDRNKQTILIGHPAGVMETIYQEFPLTIKVGRTARLLMEGFVYTKSDYNQSFVQSIHH
ncbi:2-methylaconitate cis-trans isomerase PrpF family protein [Jeotgalibacillus proteolyticus]|uniref:3-methylitaconate isomerase n=1 Tax=Jeotgalibacillus proteolyticus TaxID=2082395 RepID=A0A2S5G872_9BACL|nr:PrpF domain-containing protein [Jeotgalibacillus proteolyticus]PPA69124.1 3-methylitaconate isomerase [Jeotgalibacillus proteolyticus]